MIKYGMKEYKKILLIENNPTLAEDISRQLSAKNYCVVCAKNGLDGIELICHGNPDLIILNPTICDISGIGVYKFLKDSPVYFSIPVLIFVGNGKGVFKFWGMKSYMNQKMVKFTTMVELIDDVDKLTSSLPDDMFGKRDFYIQSGQFKEVLKKTGDGICQYGDTPRLNCDGNILGQLLEKITGMLDSEVGSFMIIQEETQELSIGAAKGLSDEVIQRTRVRFGKGISGWVAKTGKPLLIHDIEKDEKFARENNSKYYTASLLSVPVRIGKKVIAVINVNNKTTKEPFTEYDLSILTLLTDEISIAIESLGLQKRLEDAEARIKILESSRKVLTDITRLLDKELYELTISQEVSNIIYSRLDYKEIADAILEIVERSINCHLCGILFVDENRKTEIVVEIKYPTTQREIDSFKAKMVDTFNRLSGESLVAEQVTISQMGNNGVADSLTNDRDILNSYHSALLTTGDKVLGMLAIANSFSDAFENEDMTIFSIIARHSSVAINNTFLDKKLRELSVTDGLTGLYVYRYFNDALEREISRAGRYKQGFSLIMMDLDGFKAINDTFGHLQGDAVLKEVAGILKKICREVDIVARYGGEEFAVILPETDLDGAYILADRIRAVIKNYTFGAKDKLITLTASLGLAGYPEDATAKTELIKEVDRALYKAKANGRDCVCRVSKEIKNEI